jgi:uncharacterized DUF497 family protein
MNLDEVAGFDWDEANVLKNWEKHKVKHIEAEEVFGNEPKLVFEDVSHSKVEKRYFILGKTISGQTLAVFFTFRADKIRVISARDMNRKERIRYEEAT